MRKSLFIYSIIFSFVACKKLDFEQQEELKVKQTIVDTIDDVDKDKNGCLAGAGYVWSILNKECIKLYESTITLYPEFNQNNEDETQNAYLIFEENNGNEAELFLPSQVKSIILIRQSEGQPWIFNEWKLLPSNGFVLKKGEEILFLGDGGIGPKVTGSDKLEE
jgi:hypothetical protein